MPVGFYKRGCQVKTLLLSREEGIFFGHPAQLAAPRTLSEARLASLIASDICGIMFLRSFARLHCAIKQRDGNCQPWFYLRLVAYGFVGLSEGA